MRSLRISAKSYIPCIIPSKCPIHLPAPRRQPPTKLPAFFFSFLPSFFGCFPPESCSRSLTPPCSSHHPFPCPNLLPPSLSCPLGPSPSWHSRWWGMPLSTGRRKQPTRPTSSSEAKNWHSGEGESLIQAALYASQQANSTPHRRVRA